MNQGGLFAFQEERSWEGTVKVTTGAVNASPSGTVGPIPTPPTYASDARMLWAPPF